jgi:hypothetical protein
LLHTCRHCLWSRHQATIPKPFSNLEQLTANTNIRNAVVSNLPHINSKLCTSVTKLLKLAPIVTRKEENSFMQVFRHSLLPRAAQAPYTLGLYDTEPSGY